MRTSRAKVTPDPLGRGGELGGFPTHACSTPAPPHPAATPPPAEHGVRGGKSLEPDGKLHVAASHHVLNLEIVEGNGVPELLEDTCVLQGGLG
jgi:hypothetical protein